MLKLIVCIGGIAVYIVGGFLLSCAIGAGVCLVIQHYGASKELAEIVGSALSLMLCIGFALLSVFWAFDKME